MPSSRPLTKWQMAILNRLRDMSTNDIRAEFGPAMAHVFKQERRGAKQRYCERGALKLAAIEGARQFQRAYMLARRAREARERIAACDG